MRVNSSSCGVAIFVSGPMISCTSPPEQKFPPAPVRTTVFTDVFLLQTHERNPAALRTDSKVSGFFFCGRLSVIDADLAIDAPVEMLGLFHDSTSTAWLLQLGEQLEQLVLLAARQAGEQLDHPFLVRARHLGEGLASPARVEADAERAPVGGLVEPLDQALLLELVDDGGDVAAGHHQQARQLVHLQPLGMALELRHQVEARQRGGELLAQPQRARAARSAAVQVSRRSQMRSARWSSARAMVSRSLIGLSINR